MSSHNRMFSSGSIAFTHLLECFFFCNSFSKKNSVGAISEFCASMNYSEDALESFSHWYLNLYGGTLRPNFSYQKHLKAVRLVLPWQSSEIFYCTQFGSNRHVTSPDGFEHVFPHVITEQYYDEWCTDVFGDRRV